MLLALGLPAFWIANRAARIALAARRGKAVQPALLKKALALDTANPEICYRLGWVYSLPTEEANLSEEVKYFRRAAEMRPCHAPYWADLGMACEEAGDNACADQAFGRALNLNPMMPRLYWVVASHYLRTGGTDRAMDALRHLLLLSPNYAGPAFRLCLQAVGDPKAIYEKVLPQTDDPTLRLSYLNFLAERGEFEAAHEVWTHIVAHPLAFDFPLARPYVEFLLRRGLVPQAEGVWQDLVRNGVIAKASGEDQDNLVFNGGFERDPLNAGFDWRIQLTPDVLIDPTSFGAYQGSHCLRLDFTVSNNDNYEPLYQFVPVTPGQAYVLTGYVRSDGITSDSGPRLRVADPACPSCLEALTESTVGTAPWHAVSVRFSTGPQSELVRLSVWRPRSRSFPSEIAGTFWLDGVSLRPVNSADETAQAAPSSRP